MFVGSATLNNIAV